MSINWVIIGRFRGINIFSIAEDVMKKCKYEISAEIPFYEIVIIS